MKSDPSKTLILETSDGGIPDITLGENSAEVRALAVLYQVNGIKRAKVALVRNDPARLRQHIDFVLKHGVNLDLKRARFFFSGIVGTTDWADY